MDVALELPLTCPECGAVFGPPSAESYAFNSEGACPRCEGTDVPFSTLTKKGLDRVDRFLSVQVCRTATAPG